MAKHRSRVLIVEDEFAVAADLACQIEDWGFEPVGPVGRVGEALELAEEERLDAAIVDFNLHGEASTPVIDALLQRDVPVVLSTAYAPSSLPAELARLPRVDKPFMPKTLRQALLRAMTPRHRPAKADACARQSAGRSRDYF